LGAFLIYTDQQSLVQLTHQWLHTSWQQKLYSKPSGLQFYITYKPGFTNRTADALTCKSFHDSTCAAISMIQPQWIQEVLAGYAADPATTEMLAKLSIDPNAVPEFTLRDGVLRYGSRI